MDEHRIELREAVNVPDALERDALVRRLKKLRARVVLDKNTYEHWNRLHPNEQQLDTRFEESVIAWIDGAGPMPDEIRARLGIDRSTGGRDNG